MTVYTLEGAGWRIAHSFLLSEMGIQAQANLVPSLISQLQLTRHGFRYSASAKHTAPTSQPPSIIVMQDLEQR